MRRAGWRAMLPGMAKKKTRHGLIDEMLATVNSNTAPCEICRRVTDRLSRVLTPLCADCGGVTHEEAMRACRATYPSSDVCGWRDSVTPLQVVNAETTVVTCECGETRQLASCTIQHGERGKFAAEAEADYIYRATLSLPSHEGPPQHSWLCQRCLKVKASGA